MPALYRVSVLPQRTERASVPGADIPAAAHGGEIVFLGRRQLGPNDWLHARVAVEDCLHYPGSQTPVLSPQDKIDLIDEIVFFNRRFFNYKIYECDIGVYFKIDPLI